MANEDIEKHIKALFDHQAQLTSDISRLESSIEEMKTEADADRREIRDAVNKLSISINTLAEQAEDDRQAVRESFNRFEADISRLVNIVENTRDFSQQVARLAVASEKRLTVMEERINKPGNSPQ